MSSGCLIVVHPASCIGSAAFNLGRSLSADLRLDLVDELSSWNCGPVVVFDSAFGDELGGTELGGALDAAVQRNPGSFRIRAGDEDDFNQVAAVPVVIERLALSSSTRIRLTGAWIDSTDPTTGCVTSVATAFDKLACVPKSPIRPLTSRFPTSRHCLGAGVQVPASAERRASCQCGRAKRLTTSGRHNRCALSCRKSHSVCPVDT